MKKLNELPIIRVISFFIIPYIFLLVLYIQVNGENSPGGGFQAGAILASCFILYEVLIGLENFKKYFSIELFVIMAIIGTLIYLITGLISLFFGGNFLSYKYLPFPPDITQSLGIILVEIGVGFTVSSVLILIYLLFRE